MTNSLATCRAFGLAGASLLALAGCVPGDEGLPCVLLRGGDAGAAPLLEGEVSAGKDVVSYGSPDCEARMCVRDAAFQPKSGAPGGLAQGYCTRPCTPATGCRSADPAIPLVCRQLIYGGDFICAAEDGPVL